MSTQPPLPPGVPPNYQMPVQPPLPPAKKTNILVWIFGGIAVLMIGGLVTCGGIAYFVSKKIQNAGFDGDLAKQNPAYAIAKMGATMAPNVDVVSSDDDKGIIRIREKDSGKEVTLKFDPVKKTMVVVNEDGKVATVRMNGEGDKGAIEVETAEGTTKFGSSATSDIPDWVPQYPGSKPEGNFSMQTGKGKQGGYSFKTPDAPSKVMGFYVEQMKAAGYKMGLNASSDDGGLISGNSESTGHSLTVTVGKEGGGSQVMVMAVTK